jgi:putative FmdB family regulatory protein
LKFSEETMAIYEYNCKKCKEKFTVIQGRYNPEKDIECPECISEKVKQVMLARKKKLSSDNQSS